MLNIDLASFFFILVFSALFFLAIRGLLIWYWKINDLIQNQYSQNRILRSILEEIKKLSDKKEE
jgi:hypothetical protein